MFFGTYSIIDGIEPPATIDNEGAKMSKNFIFAKSDLKHPQTTLESHLDGFGDDWDRLG